jgi:hypothetical protein
VSLEHVVWKHCDDLEARDLLGGSRARCRYGFAALNHGLAAMAKGASVSTPEVLVDALGKN